MNGGEHKPGAGEIILVTAGAPMPGGKETQLEGALPQEQRRRRNQWGAVDLMRCPGAESGVGKEGHSAEDASAALRAATKVHTGECAEEIAAVVELG